MGLLLNKKGLADAIDVDVQTIKLWQDWGMPVKSLKAGREGHQYDLGEVFHWRLARNEEGAETTRERLSRANAEMKELDLAKERGLVVDREDVVTRLAACVSAMRNRLRAMRRKVAPLIATPERRTEVEEILGKHIDEALTEMASNEFAEAITAGPEADTETRDAPAKTLRKSVGRRKAKA